MSALNLLVSKIKIMMSYYDVMFLCQGIAARKKHNPLRRMQILLGAQDMVSWCGKKDSRGLFREESLPPPAQLMGIANNTHISRQKIG